MNIGLNKIITIYLFLFSAVFAQVSSNNSLVFEVSPGYSISKERNEFILMNRPNRESFSFTAKLLWKPEYLLRIGIESGYIKISSVTDKNIETEFGTTNVKFNLSAIPVVLFADMCVNNVEFSAGMGYYYLYSSLNAFREKSTSYSWDLGYNFGLAYNFLLLDNLYLSPEIKYHLITSDSESVFNFNLKFSYSFYNW